MTKISSVNIPMFGSEIISRKGFLGMAFAANNHCIAHKSVTLKAQKKAHSGDGRSPRSVVICFIALICSVYTSYADEASDIASIKQDVQMLRTLINNQTIYFYNWETGDEQNASGTQQAIAFTLRNIAIGLHDSILPTIERLGNNVTNLHETVKSIGDTLNNLDYNVSSLSSTANIISSTLEAVKETLSGMYFDVSNGIYGLLNEVFTLRKAFEQYKDLSLSYLQSIDNNVGVIVELQTQTARYIADIYNSISAGINVSIANGFPEPIDYTALLERISYNNLWGNYEDYGHNRVGNRYISGGITWTYLNDLSTNSFVKTGINLSGDFFSDVVDILSCSDEKLAAIQKSLMILCQNTQSNNVQDVDLDAEANDGIPTDTMDNPTDITAGLSFQSTSGHLTLPDIKGLEGKQFPNFISFEVPPLMGNSGGVININLNKYSTVIETARNLCLFFYWAVTVTLFITLYCLFSKYVLSNLLKLAFAFVQKGKAV